MQGSRFITKRKKQCRRYSFLVLFLCSCSSPEWILKLDQLDSIEKDITFGREDRTSLLFFIQKVYEDFSFVNRLNIRTYSRSVTDYLNSLVKVDEHKNSLKLSFKYSLWKSDEVFYFISPKGEVFFSEGFVEKFLQTEDILKVVLMECYLREKYGVYNFKEGFPTGYKTISNLSSLLLVSLQDKRLLNNWIYVLLKNNKTDTNSILYWMQEKIRAEANSYYVTGSRGDSLKEEQYIKEYLLKQGIFNEEEDFGLQSKRFFKFKREFSSW
jgi:hypothetical protein